MNREIVFLVTCILGISSILHAQVKEHEILTKDKLGNPTFMKLSETRVNADIGSVESLLKK